MFSLSDWGTGGNDTMADSKHFRLDPNAEAALLRRVHHTAAHRHESRYSITSCTLLSPPFLPLLPPPLPPHPPSRYCDFERCYHNLGVTVKAWPHIAGHASAS